MNKPLCYLLSALIYDVFLLGANSFYFFDFIPPAYAFLLLQPNKKKAIFWLFGLNLFLIFIVISYILNSDFDTALAIFIRTNLILLLILSLLLGKDSYFLIKAFYTLKTPQKLLGIMIIYAKLFEELLVFARQIPLTLKARGVRSEISLFTYKSYANIIGKIIICGFDRSFGIFRAMIARGYSGKIAFLPIQRANSGEILLLLIIILVAILRICFKFGIL